MVKIIAKWWNAFISFLRRLFSLDGKTIEQEVKEPHAEEKTPEITPDDKPEQPNGGDENGIPPVEDDKCPDYDITYTKTGNAYMFRISTL